MCSKAFTQAALKVSLYAEMQLSTEHVETHPDVCQMMNGAREHKYNEGPDYMESNA